LSENESDGDGQDKAARPGDARNYITSQGFQRLRDELQNLVRVERPKVVEAVAWAAGNGDRSENGDYIYGKRRLREIDRRIRFLTGRLKAAFVVDPTKQPKRDQIFFGATVTYADGRGLVNVVTIVGADEADLDQRKISWVSPLARAVMKARKGDVVELRRPGGIELIEVLDISYQADEHA
jgi:transcription elongation factor GreB